ncbi:FAS-associated factor 2-B [Fulvia fulva]|uniref:FAS-associated factor 2-B n=1 Tax=Passalora fulva TaxID=5499 RepID=A0A9Q8P5K0_PASFU|nr:FAS-associated factor 2-B [Fulvia fulva]KAK4631748.1 FAS-associated factor 2-B [Fulvia fulva]KAK4632549.1 FAS-associated factor 2-B [Fulvia fulva]UJO14009.1 FAS-associated factor 2-B [Fulvia fulva]WPV11949.1 FAS-associated factor 2-B [Fulvia fulva]WPV26218.1 FAS-associated factor 2-B [Fulvia fulva]
MAGSPTDLTALTEEQQLALQQFTSVTDQELDAALPLLQRCQWNAQIAITRFFDGDAETVDPAAEAARAPPPQDTRRAETLMDSIPNRSSTSRSRASGLEPAPRVVPTPENQLTQQLPFPFSLILLPFNLTYVLFQRLLGTVGYFFPVIPRLLARFWSGRASRPSRDASRRPLGPRDTAARFIREFEEENGGTHGTLPFHEGGYAQAFDLAKRHLKYLLVVLLSPEHDDNTLFVRETLLSPEFKTFANDDNNNIVLWAGTVQDAEAYQVSTALNVTRFPYAALIVHTPSVSSTAMSKVATSSGPIAAQDLITKLRTAMQAQSAELDRVRRQRSEQAQTRNLRQEQESAYERSLAQDREKARRRKEEEAQKEKAEREERERSEQKENKARNLAQWRRRRAQSIHAEPGADVKDAVRISLRMPSGERVIRKFRPDAELEELYAFVECYDQLEEVSEKEVAAPTGYQHTYKFQLVSPMPREVYDLEKGGSIRDRIGRSGNLIVEKILGEDDEGDEEDE